jgi:glycosyltransferase involved in cell wall biosynthesis
MAADWSELVTVVVVPRDRFSMMVPTIERIHQETPLNVPVIVVDGGACQEVRTKIETTCRSFNYRLLRSKTYAAANQARNAGLDHVKTKYVVFVDNDVLVSNGWLEPLVRCAEETGAWVVGPIICERLPEATWLHGYDGELELRTGSDGRRYYHDYHHNAHVPLANVHDRLQRQETGFVEFHCQLVAMEAYEEVGRYDEQIANAYDYSEFLLRFADQKGKVMLEPDSIVTFIPPNAILPEEREYFELRWSEAWTDITERRLADKFDLALNHPEGKSSHRFARAQRMLGKRWLKPIRRRLGHAKTRYIERHFLVPIEVLWNRRKYPPLKHSRIEPAKFDVVT